MFLECLYQNTHASSNLFYTVKKYNCSNVLTLLAEYSNFLANKIEKIVFLNTTFGSVAVVI